MKYHRKEITNLDIFSLAFMQDARFSGVIMPTCPILLKIKPSRPLFWSEMQICEFPDTGRIRRIVFKAREMRDHSTGISSLEYEDFIVLPLICTGYPYEILRDLPAVPLNHLVYHDWIRGLKTHRVYHVLLFMLQLVASMEYNPDDCQVIEEVIRGMTEPGQAGMKYALLKRLDLNRVAILYSDWMKEILLEFPEFLAGMQEESIRHFFSHNRRWFLSTLCRRRPVVYKYVQFYYD